MRINLSGIFPGKPRTLSEYTCRIGLHASKAKTIAGMKEVN
jgi:hypothetical protein